MLRYVESLSYVRMKRGIRHVARGAGGRKADFFSVLLSLFDWFFDQRLIGLCIKDRRRPPPSASSLGTESSSE